MTNKYFTPYPATLEELKTMYKKLAIENHPDRGGETATMQAINNEYDMLFPIFKTRYNFTAQTSTTETANSTRRQFYTEYGWQGENYNSKLTLKEIACIIREFIKIHYNDFKFSVTTEYFSGGCSLYIYLMESPYSAYKTPEEWTEDEQYEAGRISLKLKDYHHTESEIKQRLIESFMTDKVKEALNAVENYANSFNYDDSDGMIDYFNTNFYFHGVKIGKWNKPYKIVERTKKNVSDVEYENVEVTKTRTYKTLEAKDIETPVELKPGQLFQLKSSFNYGCNKNYVYQIDKIIDDHICAYKMGKGYKNICKGTVPGNRFAATIEKIKKWIEKDVIKFVELIEVTKTEEYKSNVRKPKKQTGVSTEVKEPAAADTTSDAKTNVNNEAFTITSDKDTRDNSDLWVLKIIRTLAAEEYKQISTAIKKIGGFYSKFKRGFIFRYDPTEALKKVI